MPAVMIMRTLQEEIDQRLEAYRTGGPEGLARRSPPPPADIAKMIAASSDYPDRLKAAAMIPRRKRTLKQYLTEQALAALKAEPPPPEPIGPKWNSRAIARINAARD